MLDGYKTYIIGALGLLAGLFSYFGSFVNNTEWAALFFIVSGSAISIRDAIKKLK